MGLAMIINNAATEFPGSVVDTQALSQAFKTLGFAVEVKEDCTYMVLSNKIKMFQMCSLTINLFPIHLGFVFISTLVWTDEYAYCIPKPYPT